MITVKDLTAEEKLRLICGKDAWRTEDLGGKLPQLAVSDGPVGLRKVVRGEDGKEYDKPSVAYPAIQCLANGWDRGSARAMGEALADDCLENDVDILLAPGVNIKRNPLNGRNFEYFSEDPFLAGSLAYEYIDGLQSRGVGACLKHFYANNLEFNRLDQSSDVDERTLREIYLKPFELACRAKPVSVMCSYNRINGVYASENKKGFRILREEFGFDGAIVSDWSAVHDRAKAAKAGLDLEMPFDQKNYDKLVADYKAGLLSDEELDACAQRMLDLICRCKKMRGDNKPEKSEGDRLAVAQKVAEEGIVLLKNDGVLPLKKGVSVAVCGEFAALDDGGRIGGGGSARVQWIGKPYDLAALLREKLGGEVRYNRAFGERAIESFRSKGRDALENAAECDVNVVCVGTGDTVECEAGDRASMKLSSVQEEVILETAAQDPNTVVVVFAGSVIDVSAWEDSVAAIVYAGFCGERGGEAVAEVLTGEINPSGKLSETFPLCIEDTPSYRAYNDICVSRYEEGLDVGYRYYDTYGKPVAFPFGFGLSYTDFGYEDLKIRQTGDLSLEVAYKISNLGEVSGKEVSQLYVRACAPYVYRPYKELKGFSKDEIGAGKSVSVKISLDSSAFSYYSTALDCWTVEDGLYEICVGASSADIRLSAFVRIKEGKIASVKIN